MMNRFEKQLQQLKDASRFRALKLPGGVDLTSNDYLGFADHPALKRTAVKALDAGLTVGSGGSRLLRGHQNAHAELEEFAADYFGAEKTLYFSTGFQANTALFTTLINRHDTVLFDSLIHASVRDGIQASNAKRIKIPHNDLNAFEQALKKTDGPKWIAVESLYSMDGDVAPIRELLGLAEQYDAMLIVDEAHATGIFGKNGKGFTEGLPHQRLITLHTCGKALGVAGGLICARRDIIETLVNKARGFIYSTAPMPLQAILVKRALELVQEEPHRRAQLKALCDHAKSLFGGPGTQIVPILLGKDDHAVFVAESLQESGFDIRAIRPPTVPEGTARLRLSLNTNLTKDTLNHFAGCLTPLLEGQAA